MGKGKGKSHRRSGGTTKWSLEMLDCRCLPHGYYSLVPTVFSSMAYFTALVQDGCDYATLVGDSIETIAASDVIPYIEAGIAQFRAPIFYPSEREWKMVFTEECQDYPEDSMDIFWKLARWFTFCSSILGGALALFLCCTTCLTFAQRTWRFCGAVAFFAAICRAGSFFYFLSSICTEHNTDCELAFGAKMDITGVCLWLSTSVLLIGNYPEPKLRIAADEEMDVSETENLAPKRLT